VTALWKVCLRLLSVWDVVACFEYFSLVWFSSNIVNSDHCGRLVLLCFLGLVLYDLITVTVVENKALQWDLLVWMLTFFDAHLPVDLSKLLHWLVCYYTFLKTIPRRPVRPNGSYPRDQGVYAGLKPSPTSSSSSPGFSREVRATFTSHSKSLIIGELLQGTKFAYVQLSWVPFYLTNLCKT